MSFLWASTFLYLVSLTRAFTFSFDGTISQCGNLNITWTGGTAPFQLELVPFFGTQRIVSIPSSTFSGGKGSFQTQLAFPEKQQFIMTMSDATGFAKGGVTNVLTVVAGTQSCNTSDPGVDFDYQLNSALQQCRLYTFSGYTGAVQPITITGFIPGGQTFVLHPPSGPTSFDWTASVTAGTSVVFSITDSKGRIGGSSDIELVSNSGDTSCLDSNSPSSTANSPSAATPTSTSSSSSSTFSAAPAATTSAAAGSSISIGAIAGTVIGSLLAVAALVTLGLFFLRKKQHQTGPYDLNFRDSHRLQSADEFDQGHRSQRSRVFPYPVTGFSRSSRPLSPPPEFTAAPQFEPSPFTLQSPTLSNHPLTEANPFEDNVQQDNRHNSMTTTTSAARQKAAVAGASIYKPSRFILHTDAGDASPEEEIFELPPQYTDRRQPPTEPTIPLPDEQNGSSRRP